jgi:ankyrin repeat protein
MRFAFCIAGVCLLALVAPSAVTQESRDPGAPLIRLFKEKLKDKRAVEQIRKDNAFIRTAGAGDLEAVRNGLRSGAIIDSPYFDSDLYGKTGATALMFAVFSKRTETVKLLLEHKPNLELEDLDGKTALYLAVTSGDNEIINLLVKAGAKQDPSKIRLTEELLRAACKGYKREPHDPLPRYPGAYDDCENAADLTTVLKKGADVNLRNRKGYTALMFAANLALVENVRTLLDHGADPTIQAANGDTALSLAEHEDRFGGEERRAVVKLLKEQLAKKR